ncbi:serine/Arginine-related protein 53-like [Tachyglossus aculeatus]|uniref:serine/Arginine-related protein 53-like n=1 Tax=Tachyglossus aculeatus TaxID=9261 RepID=UPI0018F6AC15|nr:serine/Arginine-related protein 53-like [Tachyglossus aculeatus]
MGRRSSDSGDERRSGKRKQRRRRRSSSSSSSDGRKPLQKKGRKSRSKSRPRSRDLQCGSRRHDKRRRRRSSSSSSRGSRRKRSRSRSRGRGKSGRSGSKRREKASRRARSRSSKGAGREWRRGRDKEHPVKEREKGKGVESHKPMPGDLGNFTTGMGRLGPAERAKAMLVLEATPETDEALMAKIRNEEEAGRKIREDQATLGEQVKRIKEIEAVESNPFVQQTFRSSREVKKAFKCRQEKSESTTKGFADLSNGEKDASAIPTSIKYQDDESLAHPNLFIEKAKAEEAWFKRLIALRRERLMGSPVA